MKAFTELHRRLAPAWQSSRDNAAPVCVVLPSYSVGPSALAHYAHRLVALEHRFLVNLLELGQDDTAELLFVLSATPDPGVVDYYVSLLPPERQADVRARTRIVAVPGTFGRPVSARLLARPDILGSIRRQVEGRPVYVDPWNVTDDELAVAERLDAPVHGTAPELWPLGFKSAGRRLFASVGVPTPPGVEDVRTVSGAEAAIRRLRRNDPELPAVVLKLDNSVSGVGNQVVSLQDVTGGACSMRTVRERLGSLPDWYVAEMGLGAVVEAFVPSGHSWSSPSVQLEILPGSHARVLSTHEQVLGGNNGQVYEGCTFPARAAYSPQLIRYGRRIGEALAARGVAGRVSADFVATRSRGEGWRLFALELNLRKGGTTHPFTVLSSLVPGRLDRHGRWRLPDGTLRYYRATDNLVDPRWLGLPATRVIAAVASSGLGFDRVLGTGVVLHMLSGLKIDGRLGLTAIGCSPAQVAELFAAVRPLLDRLSDERAVRLSG
jgi:hypothetical protein